MLGSTLPDLVSPNISSVASSTGTSTASITWNTNEGANSQVDYGTTTSYGSQTTLDTSYVTSHTVNIIGLTPGTLYHFRVRSIDQSSNLAISVDYTFTTTANTSPTLTTSSASSITTTTVTLNGNITATGGAGPTIRGFVYGTDATLATVIATTTENGSFSTGAYTGNIDSLTCATTYYARPYATNSTGTGLGSISDSFTTSACPITETPAATTATPAGNGPITGSNVNIYGPYRNVGTTQPSSTATLISTLTVGIPTISVGTTNTVSSTPAPAFTRNLSLHTEGDDVRELQKYLNQNGYTVAKTGVGSPGQESSYFGIATYRALARFQKDHNIPQSGYFGPLTKQEIIETAETTTIKQTEDNQKEKTINRPLFRGTTGEDVKVLQSILLQETTILTKEDIVGIYGAKTFKAVMEFQCKHNIICEGDETTTGFGVVGPRTLKVLESLDR